MLYAPWQKEVIEMLESRKRFWQRQAIWLFMLLVFFWVGHHLGYRKGIVIGRIEGRQSGIDEGKYLEKQSPSYKKAKADWINDIIDQSQKRYEQQLRLLLKE